MYTFYPLTTFGAQCIRNCQIFEGFSVSLAGFVVGNFLDIKKETKTSMSKSAKTLLEDFSFLFLAGKDIEYLDFLLENLNRLGCVYTGRCATMQQLLERDLVDQAAKVADLMPKEYHFDLHGCCPILPYLISYFYATLRPNSHTIKKRLSIGCFLRCSTSVRTRFHPNF